MQLRISIIFSFSFSSIYPFYNVSITKISTTKKLLGVNLNLNHITSTCNLILNRKLETHRTATIGNVQRMRNQLTAHFEHSMKTLGKRAATLFINWTVKFQLSLYKQWTNNSNFSVVFEDFEARTSGDRPLEPLISCALRTETTVINRKTIYVLKWFSFEKNIWMHLKDICLIYYLPIIKNPNESLHFERSK